MPEVTREVAAEFATDAARARLIGAWSLERWTISYGDGRPASFPFGEEPQGLLLYTADGHMNASIARPGRKPLSSDSVRSAPDAERLAAFESFFNYAGRYRLEGDTVIHEVTLALNPGFVGTRQLRRMRFSDEGRMLTLSGDDKLPGTQIDRRHALTWRRAG